VSPRAALADALLITLTQPATWPMALATFLLRGGLLLVVLPIVVLPSPVGLGNVLGPALTTVVLSGVPAGLAIVVTLIAIAILAWVVIGGLVAAILEAESARLVARHDEAGALLGVEGDRRTSGREAAGVLAARLVVHIPTVVALIVGSARLVSVAYRELTSPSDVVNPIAVRVLRSAPEAIVIVAVLWMLGEILGGIAARRIVLAGSSVPRALRESLVWVVRRPLPVLVEFWVPAAVLALVILASAVAAATAWGIVRVAMGSSTDPFGSTLAVLLFVALWMIGLLLIAVTNAWRAAVWSLVERDHVTLAATR